MLVDKLNDSELEQPYSGQSSRPDDHGGFQTDLPDDLLSETQAFPTAASHVNHFTYPSGSKPLPRYTIRRGIGMGGFGEVYFAVSDAGKEVALKRIQRNLDVELRGVSHCLNLKHPNLVSLHDICQTDADGNDIENVVGTSDGASQWWVVMEYIAGPNLREVLDDSPNGLPETEVRRWFSGMAAGIGHLHDAGLVHRDVKPGNVFDDLGIVKVGDYGLSKFISSSHRGGHTESVGTFHYMAPEIGQGQYGREIDIYALGIVLHELLTGRVPFDGESCHEIIVKHLTAVPDLSGVASPYRETIAKCLEKDPQRRFANVGELMRSLNFDPTAETESRAFVAKVSQAGSPAGIPAGIPAGEVPAGEVPAMDHGDSEVLNATLVPENSLNESVAEEPLARAIRNSIGDLGSWWRTLDRSPGLKALLFTAAILILIVNTSWLFPLLTLVGFVYVPYYIVRQMVLHVSQQPSYAQAQRIAGTQTSMQHGAAAQHGFPVQKLNRKQWQHNMRSGLRAKHSVHRLAELNTSWVAATFSVVVLGLIAGVVGLRSGPLDALAIAPYGLVAAMVLFASVSLLGLGKLWEREEGEGLTRRLVLAGVGAGVGAITFAMSDFLMLPLSEGMIRDVDVSTLPQTLYYDSTGAPTVTALMAHFALLFASLRWWKTVDPLRRTRLSLWSVAVAVVAEWAVHQLLPIPQPAGMMIAGGTAIVVQMSALWISPSRTNDIQTSGNPAGEIPAGAIPAGIPVNTSKNPQPMDPQSFQRGAV
ncbi:serine/threonine-protein kinase [Rubripirellula obstinata]|nr:serine/threonine-protein kinase [Rubripirellula obstinata]